jgi:transposase
MPKHYDAEVKARAVRLVTEHKVESGSVTKSCEAVGRRLGSVRRPYGGGVAKLRSTPASGRGDQRGVG